MIKKEGQCSRRKDPDSGMTDYRKKRKKWLVGKMPTNHELV